MEKRTATVERKTQETDIKVSINLDGSGVSKVSTGIGFFDHMLQGFAKHGYCIPEGISYFAFLIPTT